MPRQNNLVVGLIVHDAVEARPDFDLFDHCERLQIKHRDRLIPAIGRKAMTKLADQSRAVYAGRIGNVTGHFAGRAFDHHHVRGPRNEYPAGGRFDGDVVRAAIAFDIELLDLKSLRVPCKGRRKADPKDNDKSRGETFGHGNLRFRFDGL